MQVADRSFVGLLDGVPDAMVCVDRSGRIALVNAQTERLFGYRRAELANQPVEMLVPDAARAAHPGYRARYMAAPKLRPMGARTELSGRRRDGSTFPAEILLSAIGTHDGLLVIVAVRDVTGRLELRAEAGDGRSAPACGRAADTGQRGRAGREPVFPDRLPAPLAHAVPARLQPP
jgi:PAS domain S-box-containing protein